MNMFKSAGGGWQIFSKTLAGKEINEHQFFLLLLLVIQAGAVCFLNA